VYQVYHITQRAHLWCAMGLARCLRLRLTLCSWVWLLRLRLGRGLVVVLVRYWLPILVPPHVYTRRETWWVEESACQVCLRC